jgi:hypothetical protein
MNSQGLMTNFLNRLWGNPEQSLPPVDPTVYLVRTVRHAYTGKIIFQDDYLIKFLSEEGEGMTKPVKILKENIHSIDILSVKRA